VVPEWFAILCAVGVLGGLLYALRLVGVFLVDMAHLVRSWWVWARRARADHGEPA
jgi:hypothetical protein